MSPPKESSPKNDKKEVNKQAVSPEEASTNCTTDDVDCIVVEYECTREERTTKQVASLAEALDVIKHTTNDNPDFFDIVFTKPNKDWLQLFFENGFCVAFGAPKTETHSAEIGQFDYQLAKKITEDFFAGNTDFGYVKFATVEQSSKTTTDEQVSKTNVVSEKIKANPEIVSRFKNEIDAAWKTQKTNLLQYNFWKIITTIFGVGLLGGTVASFIEWSFVHIVLCVIGLFVDTAVWGSKFEKLEPNNVKELKKKYEAYDTAAYDTPPGCRGFIYFLLVLISFIMGFGLFSSWLSS